MKEFPKITWVEFSLITSRAISESFILEHKGSLEVVKTRNNFRSKQLIVKSHFRYSNNDMVTIKLC